MLNRKKQSNNNFSSRRQLPTTQSRRAEELGRKLFLRNRTLTGSVSSKIDSPAEKSHLLVSARVKAHNLVDQRRKLGLILAIVLAVSLALFFLVSQFTSNVEIRINGTASLESKKRYEDVIDQYYAQRPLERLRFLLDTQALTSFMQSKTSEILSANEDGSAGFAKSKILLMTRKPVAAWDVGDGRQYVDKNGVAFSMNYYASPGVKIIDKSGVPASAGEQVTSNRFLSFVGRIVGFAEQQGGYQVQEVEIPLGTTRQVQIKLAGLAYQIKFSIDRPAGEQVEDMDRSIGYLKANAITPSYLDVRVSGKAAYK